jgi:hypothetical protein
MTSAPPKGIRLLPNPETLLKQGLDASKILFIAFAILNSGASNANAEKANDQIAWAIEATKNIDIVNAYANRISANRERKQDEVFTEHEISLLTWNVFHEARGEPKEGQLGVLLSCLERMKSKSFGATADEVVFKNRQFTWTHNVNKFDNSKLKNKEIETYAKIRNEIQDILKDKNAITLNQKIDLIKNKILAELKKDVKNKITKIPDGITHYQVYKLMEDKTFSQETKTVNTLNRVKKTEEMYLTEKEKSDPKIVKLGSQIFYSEQIANQN